MPVVDVVVFDSHLGGPLLLAEVGARNSAEVTSKEFISGSFLANENAPEKLLVELGGRGKEREREREEEKEKKRLDCKFNSCF